MKKQKVEQVEQIEQIEQVEQAGLLQVKILKITTLVNKKLTTSKLFYRIGEQGYPILFDLSLGQVSLEEIKMFECKSSDNAELQYSQDKNGYLGELRFPLKKLTEMPRVKHVIEAIMIKKIDKDKRGQKDLKIQNLLQVDMELIYMNAVQGKFSINSISVQITRDNQLVGQMDPYINLSLDGQNYKTKTKQNQGKRGVWVEPITFQIRKAGKSTLYINVFNSNNLKDDLICGCEVLLLKQGLLLPHKKPQEKQFMLLFDSKGQGNVKIQYLFEHTAFNY